MKKTTFTASFINVEGKLQQENVQAFSHTGATQYVNRVWKPQRIISIFTLNAFELAAG